MLPRKWGKRWSRCPPVGPRFAYMHLIVPPFWVKVYPYLCLMLSTKYNCLLEGGGWFTHSLMLFYEKMCMSCGQNPVWGIAYRGGSHRQGGWQNANTVKMAMWLSWSCYYNSARTKSCSFCANMCTRIQGSVVSQHHWCQVAWLSGSHAIIELGLHESEKSLRHVQMVFLLGAKSGTDLIRCLLQDGKLVYGRVSVLWSEDDIKEKNPLLQNLGSPFPSDYYRGALFLHQRGHVGLGC